jgi:hypothetical protein
MTYAPGNSSTTLRKHIERDHYSEWAAHGWDKIYASGKSRGSDAPSMEGGTVRDEFNEESFRTRLVNFIVADDQVCLFAPNGIAFLTALYHSSPFVSSNAANSGTSCCFCGAASRISRFPVVPKYGR